MQRTIRVILETTDSQTAILADTCAAFTSAFNQAAQLGWNADVSNATKLHYLVYYPVKTAHPTLVSDLINQARVKAAEALRSAFALRKDPKRTVSPPHSAACPPRYNKNTYRVDWPSRTVRLSTTVGRQTLRLRVLRPFPAAAIAAALEGRKAVAVIDQNLAPGLGGITYQEIAAALYDSPARPPLLNIVGGLGGKDISEAECDAVAQDLERVAAGSRVVGPRLLYTQPEWERMRTLLRIAGKEVES